MSPSYPLILALVRYKVGQKQGPLQKKGLEEIVRTDRTTIRAQARSDGLRLLRTINQTQAHGEEGARADPTRAANQAGLDIGSERYQDAMAYLIEQAASLGDAHIAFGDDVGDQHPHGYASYFFTRRALTLLEG
jgi:hypothetical protein